MKSKLIIVDISSFIFRAFYAIRPLHAPDGTPVNAVHGVLSMVLKLLSKYQPTHILMARDTKGGSFRNELYDQYKANRDAPPEDLIPQFDLIKELQDKMNFPSSTVENYEADDIIGSAVVQWKDKFDEIYIASGDKDLMQFVGDNVKMLDTMKDKIYGRDEVFEKMGVYPEQVVDYLSMLGDTSDNIPGMKGIGAKGAAKLLAEHGTLEKCIELKDTFKGKKLINAFENHVEDALISKKLIQIVTDLDLGIDHSETDFKFYPKPDFIEFLQSLGFKSTVKKVQDLAYNEHLANQEVVESSDSHIMNKDFSHEIVQDLDSFYKVLKDSKVLALHFVYNEGSIVSREVNALSISLDVKKSYYIPFKTNAKKCFDEKVLSEIIKLTWLDENKVIISNNVKRDLSFLMSKDITYKAGYFDVPQAHYILDSSGRHNLDLLATQFLDHTIGSLNKGEKFEEIEESRAAELVGEISNCLFLLNEKFNEELNIKKLHEVYDTIDSELIPILADMELTGVTLNKDFLKTLEDEFQTKLDKIQKAIFDTAETEVNLRSPKQVGELLFEKLQLPAKKKTKTGYSTDSEVLEDLASLGLSEIPSMILEYRELDKILGTYVKALPELVDSKTGRIHTNFMQNVAATGRLSSINPNLQNIPVRSENGKRIRKGFIARPGCVLLAVDYSQIELRLLAHFSKDPTMLKAFKDGVDIHTRTASEVLGKEISEVSSNDRSKAKAVNFGLMYGQSSFGLGKALGISRGEAKEYITMYFERFSKVKGYLDSLKDYAENQGYSKTLFGRKRFLPDIYSKNRNIKSMAERIAVNSPIQGTAADIIKLAMVNIYRRLNMEELETKMILQVHDELIFEVPEDELVNVKKIVKDEMEHVVELDVPLTVDMGIGVNWFDVK